METRPVSPPLAVISFYSREEKSGIGPISHSQRGKHPHCLCVASALHVPRQEGASGRAHSCAWRCQGPWLLLSLCQNPWTSPRDPRPGGVPALPVGFSVSAHTHSGVRATSARSAPYPQAWPSQAWRRSRE